MTISFSQWSLRDELQTGLQELGFDTPTEVQSTAFELATNGRDLMVQSRTGSGKTLAFTLPILQRIDPEADGVSVLVVLPTRELCMQVATTMRRLAGHLNVKVAAIYGGGSFPEQLRAIKHGARIICGTPGRLCEHLERRTLKLDDCQTLVLDEADEMLTLGFAEDLQKIVAALPAARQTLLFSATLSDAVQELARRSMRDPEVLTVNVALSIPTEIHHVCYETRQNEKQAALANLLHAEAPGRALIFCHTKLETEQLVERLTSEGFQVALMNGDLPQPVRTRTLQLFRQGSVQLLVATDVAARGIDVEGITHVFNMAVPRTAETYVHRVGRTGRAGHFGEAVTFVTPRDTSRFKQMLHEAGVKVEVRRIPQPQAVREQLRGRYLEALGAKPPSPSYHEFARELLAFMSAEELLPLLLSRDPAARAVLEAGEAVTAAPAPREQPRGSFPESKEGRSAARRPDRERPPRREVERSPRADQPATPSRRSSKDSHETAMVRLKLNVGRRDRMTVGGLVRFICQAASLPGNALGVITVEPTSSIVDVRREHVPQLEKSLEGLSYKGRALRVSISR